MITRRLFLGGLVATPAAAVPLLETFVHDLDLDLEIDHALELQEGDVLVVRLDERPEISADQLAHVTKLLEEKVWPNVLIIPKGVDLEVIRRADRHFAAAALFRAQSQ